MTRFRRAARCTMALLTLLAWGNAVTFGAEAPPADPILSALTGKPLMLLRLPNPTGALEAIRQTQVGRHAAQEPLLASAAAAWRSIVRFGAALSTDLSEADLQRLLAREAALVVVGPSGTAGGALPAMLVADLGSDAALVKDAVQAQLLPRWRAANPHLVVESQQTAAGTLIRLRVGEPAKTCLHFAGRLLAIGPEDAVMKIGSGSGRSPLGESAALEGIALGYLDAQRVWDVALPRMGERQRRRFEGTGIPAISELWTATAVEGGGFRDAVVARLNADAAGLLPALTALPAGQTRVDRVVPARYSALLTCRIESGEKLYGLIEALVRHNEGEAGVQQFRAGIDGVDRAFAINLEWELLPAMGDEAFVAVRIPDADQLAAGAVRRALEPLWGFAVRDEQLLRELIERFSSSVEARQRGWQLITEGHAGRQVHTVSNMGAPVRFSLVVLDGHCIFAREAATLRSVIDAVGEGLVLAGDARYQAVRRALPDVFNAGVYLDTGPLKEAVLTVLRQRAPEAKRAFVPLVERLMPDLGGYGVTLAREGAELRIEGYGGLPVLFSFANVILLR